MRVRDRVRETDTQREKERGGMVVESEKDGARDVGRERGIGRDGIN